MSSARTALLLRARGLTCALPLAAVSETLRPLACQSLVGMPGYVLGASVIRGVAMAVIDLGLLLGGSSASLAQRWVVVRCGVGTVALAVDAVLGVGSLQADATQQAEQPHAGAMRGVLSTLPEHHVESLERLDGELVAVLALAQLVPDGVISGANHAERT